MIPNISVTNFLKLENPNVIDIRNSQSYNNNHIPNARNIPFEKLISRPSDYLKRDEIYYLYCTYGKKSISVCKILNNLGYRTVTINGGYESWILEQ